MILPPVDAEAEPLASVTVLGEWKAARDTSSSSEWSFGVTDDGCIYALVGGERIEFTRESSDRVIDTLKAKAAWVRRREYQAVRDTEFVTFRAALSEAVLAYKTGAVDHDAIAKATRLWSWDFSARLDSKTKGLWYRVRKAADVSRKAGP